MLMLTPEMISQAERKLAELPGGRLPYPYHKKREAKRRELTAEVGHVQRLIGYAHEAMDHRIGGNMTPQLFDDELRNLSKTVGTWDADELFPVMYEDLLAKIKAGTDQDRKIEQAQRMRKLLMNQARFLIQQHIDLQRAG